MLADREKVIRGLEVCKTAPEFREECAGCPYDDGQEDCIARMAADALELLKAQEPIEPKMSNTAIPVSKTSVRFVLTYWCGACGEAINQNDVYCRKCGQAVKWDADT